MAAMDSTLSLLTAIKQHNHAVVRVAIDEGAELDLYVDDEPISMRTPLRLAATSGDVQTVKLLLEARAEVTAGFAKDRWTALHSAAQAGHDLALHLLLTDGEVHENAVLDGFRLLHTVAEIVNPKLRDGGGHFTGFVLKHVQPEVNVHSRRLGFENWTPLHIACSRGKMKTVMHLCRAGADKRARTGAVWVQSRLFNEYSKGDGVKIAAVENFTQVEDSELDSGLLPLHVAALGGHLRTVHTLLKGSDDLHVTTHWHEWTVLHCAVWSGSTELVSELLRVSAKPLLNKLDRRTDARWSPLALATARADVPMLKLLLEHKADPLQRIAVADFPGKSFLVHAKEALHVASENFEESNTWSGPDERVSLMHLAVVRGDLDALRLIISACRRAHFKPLASPNDLTLDVSKPLSESSKVLNQAVPSMKKRLAQAPTTEQQECDPLSFSTVQGWTPGPLAILLTVVDLNRHVSLRLVEQLPTIITNNRLDIFTEVLRSGRAFGEDAGKPPIMPERFSDVCEPLVMQTCAAFARVCRAEGAQETMYRCTHMTLSAAARSNRLRTARFLLEEKLAIAACPFILPIASRPLHAACSLGFGAMSQLLIDHKADPSEADEQGLKPIEKLGKALHPSAPPPTLRKSLSII